jgi:DNA-binding response OmpR family regulator
MKTDVLLIADDWDESSAIVADAAKRTGHGFRHLAPNRACGLLSAGAARINLIAVDVDPDIHDISVLDAIASYEKIPPVIVVSSRDESFVSDVARRHGAAGCISKPFTAADLAWLMDELCPSEIPLPMSSDLWGHPRVPCKRAFQNQPA